MGPKSPPGLLPLVACEQRLGRALDRIVARRRQRGRLVDEKPGPGVPLAAFAGDRRGFLRALSATIESGGYEFSASTAHTAFLDKPRRLFRFALADAVVLAALASVVTEASQTVLGPHVYSYQAGRGAVDALRAARRFLRDGKQMGIYALRFDVASYTDSIDVSETSRLRGDLISLLTRHAGGWTCGDAALLSAALTPAFSTEQDPVQTLLRGVPTGSPLGPPLANLGLVAVDAALSTVTGGFYARYGDDILFLHKDAGVAAAAVEDTLKILNSLGLKVNDNKLKFVWLSTRGGDQAGVKGAQSVDFLGFALRSDGRFGPRSKAFTAFFRDLERRLDRTTAFLDRHAGIAQRAQALVQVTAAALGRTALAAPLCQRLRTAVDDRELLALIDLEIARAVAERATGYRGRRAFRALPYRQLRQTHGLPSLVMQRNASSEPAPAGPL